MLDKIKLYIPIKIKKILKKILRIKEKEIFKEESKSYGDLNSDKTFYVIRRTPPAAGLFSNYGVVLLHILEAEKRNLIPVIDYENYYSNYLEEELVNETKNAWEYYFKQPTKYKLEEIYKSRNVILSSEIPNQERIWNTEFLRNINYIKKLNEVSQKVFFNDKTLEYLETIYEQMIPKNKKILGVPVRGTDYNSKTAKGHPIQPSIEIIIELVKKKFEEWNCDYIFVTTEEEKTLAKFIEVFGDKVLYTQRNRYTNYKGGYITEQRFNRKNDKYLTGLEYAAEIYILSKCNSIITSSTSGVVAAFIFNNNKYENKYIFDLGYYK